MQVVFIESSLFALVVGACIQFCCYHCRQNGALKDPGIFAQPKVILSSAEPDVNARIKQKETVRKWNHAFFGARLKMSTVPPVFRRFRRA